MIFDIIIAMETVVLTGMMGSGKTSAGKLLAKKLGFNFIDVDSEIEKMEKSSVTEIFSQKGEAFFRDIEQRFIQGALKEDCVLSLGGGAFESSDTRNFLLTNSKVVYLKTSAGEILKRIKDSDNRPLLINNMNIDKITEILNLRKNNYEKAHLVVETDNKNIESVVEEITKWLY